MQFPKTAETVISIEANFLYQTSKEENNSSLSLTCDHIIKYKRMQNSTSNHNTTEELDAIILFVIQNQRDLKLQAARLQKCHILIVYKPMP
jgi:hypothetical protein